MIYNFDNYKEYLKFLITKNDKSFTKRLCEESGIHRSYFSQAINGAPHISPEHAYSIAQFLNLSSDERDYLLLLVNYNKSGTKSLDDHFKRKINEMKENALSLSQQLKTEKDNTSLNETIYFSSWRYSLVHACMFVENNKDGVTVAALESLCGITRSLLLKTLNDLKEMGLLEESDSIWKLAKKGSFHFGKNSVFLGQHHRNFRTLSIDRAVNGANDDMFYSSVHIMDEKSFEELKEKITQTIKEHTENIIRPAPAKKPVVWNIDLYKY